MTDFMLVWQCVGCGKLAGDAPCIGICEDRPLQVVQASEHHALQSQLDALRREVAALGSVVRQLAWSTPCAGEWERGYRALQRRAREALAAPGAARPVAAPAALPSVRLQHA